VGVDMEAARRAVYDQVAAPLGMDLLQAAEGIHRIANARMIRALRAVSTERGRDPRGFLLLAFGGSGPVHAAGLAHELFIRQVVVPPLPGLFSALGLLFSGVEHHDVRSCLLSGPALSTGALHPILTEMEARMLNQFQAEGFAAGEVRLHWSVDVRYRGQASEIRIPLEGEQLAEGMIRKLQAAFEEEHERLYGHRSGADNPVEVVAVRLVARTDSKSVLQAVTPVGRFTVSEPVRRAYFGSAGAQIDTPVLTRQEITGVRDGPLLIDEYDSTTVVPPSWRVRRDEHGNLILEPKHA
jgi:N-methylhydantoinase A